VNATIKIENIGVDEAREMLSKPWPDQRNLRKAHVKRLASDMRAGRFRLSQDAITIVRDLLANGQHRLQAVVEAANGSYPFLVLRTNDPEIYKVIDDGMKRQVSDYVNIENSCLVAAASSLIVMYDAHKLTLVGRQTATRGENLSYFEEHRDGLNWAASHTQSLLNRQRLMVGSVLTAFLEIGSRFDRDEALAFVTEVISGQGESGVAKLLRERLIRDRISRFRMNATYQFALLIKAYCAYYNGRELKGLKFAEGENYPCFPG
jgi:hypothetical protein